MGGDSHDGCGATLAGERCMQRLRLRDTLGVVAQPVEVRVHDAHDRAVDVEPDEERRARLQLAGRQRDRARLEHRQPRQRREPVAPVLEVHERREAVLHPDPLAEPRGLVDAATAAFRAQRSPAEPGPRRGHTRSRPRIPRAPRRRARTALSWPTAGAPAGPRAHGRGPRRARTRASLRAAGLDRSLAWPAGSPHPRRRARRQAKIAGQRSCRDASEGSDGQ
jgi:hypothetical protein